MMVAISLFSFLFAEKLHAQMKVITPRTGIGVGKSPPVNKGRLKMSQANFIKNAIAWRYGINSGLTLQKFIILGQINFLERFSKVEKKSKGKKIINQKSTQILSRQARV